MFKNLTLQSKLVGRRTRSFKWPCDQFATSIRLVEQQMSGNFRKIARLVLAVANSLMIRISRVEVFENVQNPDIAIGDRRQVGQRYVYFS